jgi:hypothetical protein
MYRLTIYGYWNEGGVDNIVSMLLYICNAFFCNTGIAPAEVISTPPTGCIHPSHRTLFDSPSAYMRWYETSGPLRHNPSAPTVAVLLYRKHVITKQPYIGQLIEQMEAEGLRPLPIFINGVEAHTVVRDQLTSVYESRRPRPQGLSRDAVQVRFVYWVKSCKWQLVTGRPVVSIYPLAHLAKSCGLSSSAGPACLSSYIHAPVVLAGGLCCNVLPLQVRHYRKGHSLATFSLTAFPGCVCSSESTAISRHVWHLANTPVRLRAACGYRCCDRHTLPP